MGRVGVGVAATALATAAAKASGVTVMEDATEGVAAATAAANASGEVVMVPVEDDGWRLRAPKSGIHSYGEAE